jgi:photosystem II stability/assembly factor-like uncharacterized protein
MRLFLVLFCISFQFVSGQLSWSETNINNSPSRYDDVFFLNENLGWAADGGGAKVFKTTDGGDSWVQQFQDGLNYFRNIEFLNENIGFLGTLNGSFFKTANGGQTWQPISVNNLPEITICGLDCVGTTTVYGCGAYFQPAYVIKSSNSGATWQFIDMSAYATALVEVLFVTENIGFVSGQNQNGGVILKTINGGLTWSIIYQTTIPGEYVWKLQILDSNPTIMFGSVSSVAPFNGKVIKSINSGVSWTSNDVPDTNVQAVGFITENHGWMGGHGSGFLETFDAGATWNDTNIGSSLNRIFFVNQNVAYTSGNSIYKLDTTLSTSNFEIIEPKQIEVRIAPNPVEDKLTIEIDFERKNNLLLELYSIDGKLLKQLFREANVSLGSKTYTFDFPYPKGSYFLNVHTNSDRQSIKIIK